MKNLIISYARNGREAYTLGMKRLLVSIHKICVVQGGISQNVLMMSPDMDVSKIGNVPINRSFEGYPIPDHRDVPYGFKPYLFALAFKLGYERVLWCDSTIVLHQGLDPIWRAANERGLWVGDNPGCPESAWTDRVALEKMGCPVDAMFNQIMACAMAFDVSNPKGRTVFEEWKTLCDDGVTFKGAGSKIHRHDQSAISWLCQKHGVPYEPYGMLCYHKDRTEKTILANTGIYEDGFYELPTGNLHRA